MPSEKSRYSQPSQIDEASAIAEMQGLYGLFSFPEKLLQKIWDRGDFNADGAHTLDGRALAIGHPGRWNRLGGPDFHGARLRLDGREITGDVEVHLREEDWAAHRHAADAAYANVVLHVVLFPPSRRTWTDGVGENRIPVLALLPLLLRGLEEYAEEDAVEALANRPLDRAWEALSSLEKPELRFLLAEHAAARWRQKVGFARGRIERLGWEAACHHAALEILGYRFNRATMLAIATEHRLDEWRDGHLEVDALFEARLGRWQLQGVRPLNHPRLRLRQYAAWVRARPDWPEILRGREASTLHAAAARARGEGIEFGTARAVRAAAKLGALRERLAEELCGGVIGGSRFDTLVCDGFLPLLAAADEATGRGCQVLWRNWFAGDMPEERAKLLRRLGVFGAGEPATHGPLQGLLGWLLARDAGPV